MSYTGLKEKDAVLHCTDLSSISHVFLSRDETQVPRLIAFIHVNPVNFQSWHIPAFKRDQIREERAPIFSPRLEHENAPASVVAKSAIFGVMTPVEARRNATEKASPVAVV